MSGSTILADILLRNQSNAIQIRAPMFLAYLIRTPAAPAGKGWLAAPGYTETTTLVSVKPSATASDKLYASPGSEAHILIGQHQYLSVSECEQE